MKKTFKSGLIVLIVLILVVIGVSILGTFAQGKITNNFNFPTQNSSTGKMYSATPGVKAAKEFRKQYIGAVYLEGTIEVSNSRGFVSSGFQRRQTSLKDRGLPMTHSRV